MMMGSIAPRSPAPPSAAPNLRRRAPVMRPVSLPTDVRRVLTAIVADMRNVPRNCIGDPAELFHWLRRMANRVEGVERIQIPVDPKALPRAAMPQARPLAANSALREMEAAFKPSEASPKPRMGPARIVRTRKGKEVQVETKQLSLWGQG